MTLPFVKLSGVEANVVNPFDSAQGDLGFNYEVSFSISVNYKQILHCVLNDTINKKRHSERDELIIGNWFFAIDLNDVDICYRSE
jgi:hypothetical protein